MQTLEIRSDEIIEIKSSLEILLESVGAKILQLERALLNNEADDQEVNELRILFFDFKASIDSLAREHIEIQGKIRNLKSKIASF